jgi:hypothetical protein
LRNLTPNIQSIRRNLNEAAPEDNQNNNENFQDDNKYFSNDAKDNLPEGKKKMTSLHEKN